MLQFVVPGEYIGGEQRLVAFYDMFLYECRYIHGLKKVTAYNISPAHRVMPIHILLLRT